MINGRKIVALCAYSIYDSQVFNFISEFNKLLIDNNCYLFIYAINTEIGNGGDNTPEVAVFDLLPYDKVDAVVIMDEKIKSRETVQGIIDKTSAHHIPAIVIDGVYDNVSMVNYDYARGFEKVVRHVIEHHRIKKPHFMAGKVDSPFSNERIEVFKKVIAENNIEFDDSMLSYGDFWAIPSRKAAHKLLEREQLPEAIICANDIMAINVCDVFQAAGVRVPEEVLVSGFDGIDEAFWSAPGITTAKCDSAILASSVNEVVQEVLSGKRNILKQIVPSFIANDSCGCPRCSQDLISAINGLNNRFYHHQDDIHIMQTLTSRIMSGQNTADSLRRLRNPLTANLCIVVEDSCFDLENNYLFEDMEKGPKSVIFDSYSEEDGIKPYDPETIVPHLDEIMEKECPLVFNGLEYMGKCPGFVCYSFKRLELVDYSRTPNLTNALGMGLGGYIINRYQQYLREKLERMYQKDALTGLYNRLAFMSKYDELILNPRNAGKKLTMFMSDMNGLKQINDTHGHLAGDKAISAVAEAFRKSCPSNAICARIGGDEMLAVTISDCDPEAVIRDIDKFLEEKSRELGFTVSTSVGTYTTVAEPELDLHKLIGYADEKMYAIKRNRKHQPK